MSDIDFWTKDSFEDAITRAMIALYETNYDQFTVGDQRIDQVSHATINRIRKIGVFVPAPDRVGWGDHIDGADGVPREGCLSWGENMTGHESWHTYCDIDYFRRIEKLPQPLRRPCIGPTFEMSNILPKNQGPAAASKLYYVLGPGGIPHLATAEPKNRRVVEDFFVKKTVGAMQLVADRKHTWTITARNLVSCVGVGAYPEVVKSVLYARSFPLSEMGRKRPILHLVKAHQRRIKEGIDIDIDAFLRGVREVKMDGVTYCVDPPQALVNKLGLNPPAH